MTWSAVDLLILYCLPVKYSWHIPVRQKIILPYSLKSTLLSLLVSRSLKMTSTAPLLAASCTRQRWQGQSQSVVCSCGPGEDDSERSDTFSSPPSSFWSSSFSSALLRLWGSPSLPAYLLKDLMRRLMAVQTSDMLEAASNHTNGKSSVHHKTGQRASPHIFLFSDCESRFFFFFLTVQQCWRTSVNKFPVFIVCFLPEAGRHKHTLVSTWAPPLLFPFRSLTQRLCRVTCCYGNSSVLPVTRVNYG